MIALSTQDVCLAYGTDVILKDISFAVNDGDRVGVIGVNGAGKTSLFKIIAGVSEPDSGAVYIQKGHTVGMLEQNAMLESKGSTPVSSSARLADLLRRPQISYADIAPFDASRPDLPLAVQQEVEIQLKYAGYLARQEKQVEAFRKEESRRLPEDMDYLSIAGLRVEAREKLQAIRPMSIGQAGRISGVSPSDIAVLLIYLQQQ